MERRLVSVLAVAFLASVACGYDLHTKALTPISENAVPAGSPLTLVENGECRCAIAWNVGCEPASDCGPYKRTRASIGPALEILTNAFAHVFGVVPDIVDAKDSAAVSRYDCVIALGASPLTRALGYAPEREPDQGFTIATSGRTLVIHGNDSSQIPSYNAKPWEKRGASTGTYYAALDFTERFLGVRYFFPGEWGTLWPHLRELTVRPVSYTDSPWFDARGSLYHFGVTFTGEKRMEKWRRLMGDGAVKNGDGSFVRKWRASSGSIPPGGSHAPDPQKFGARHSNDVERIFFKNPYGYLAWYPNSHYPNLYDVTDLGLIDLFMDDIRTILNGPQPPWDTKGWSTLNRTYVSWGQCDTYMSLIDVAFNRTVRELGLVNPKDIERARSSDGDLRNDAGCFANIWGRFVKAYAERVGKEFPGASLYCLVYYNAKFPPNDPRYKLPDNVEISFCDHRLPRRLLNPADRKDVVRIAREWYDALGGRPVARAWLYTAGNDEDTLTRAINPEFTGEVPKAMGKYLGRHACFFDCNGTDDLYHFYFAHYACAMSQWNPDFDVDAAIDAHWEPFYGKKAGAALREFHRVLKRIVVKYVGKADGLTEQEKYRTPATEEELQELEKLLARAEAAVEKGTVFERRFRLFAEPWPDAFEKRRRQIATEYVYTPEERRIWKRADFRIDSWDDVYTRYHLNVTPYKTDRATISLEFANPLTRYTFNIGSTKPEPGKPARQKFSVTQGRKPYGFTWADSISLSVNGKSYKDLEILPSDVKPWAGGTAHGYEVKLAFPEAPMTLRISLKPDSKFLRFELAASPGARVERANVRLSAVPSFFEVVDGKTRFYGYRREIATASRVLAGEKGSRPVELTPADRHLVFRDADYDGSTPDKGSGPCMAIADLSKTEKATACANDYWSVWADFNLKPDFGRFRFAIYEDLDRPVANARFNPKAVR
ncbi:MAG: DUF4838 domain-containing protein [Kiritimatiellae bacterium]|nr:DUF4838 domain-containing protein [Kiritimatiellia bacterium]